MLRSLRQLVLHGSKVRTKGSQQLREAKFYHIHPETALKGWRLNNDNRGGTYYSWRVLVSIKSKYNNNRYPMHVAASKIYWKGGLKEFVEADYTPLIESDYFTGLYPFMLAATGPFPDLNAIYSLLRLNPGSMDMARKERYTIKL